MKSIYSNNSKEDLLEMSAIILHTEPKIKVFSIKDPGKKYRKSGSSAEERLEFQYKKDIRAQKAKKKIKMTRATNHVIYFRNRPQTNIKKKRRKLIKSTFFSNKRER